MSIEVKDGKVTFKEEKKSKKNGEHAVMLKIDGERQEQLRQILVKSGWSGDNERNGILQVANAILDDGIKTLL